MATIIDLLRQLGRHVGPGGDDAFCGPVELPPAPLPALRVALPHPLPDAWAHLSARPTSAQHALGLAASRAGEAVAFVGPGVIPRDDALLVLAAQLAGDRSCSGLWLVRHEAAAREAADQIGAFCTRAGISWRRVSGAAARQDTTRLVIATYDELHGRLLRFADRGWRWLWHSVALVAVPDLHHAKGGELNHLRWLLLRGQRLARRRLRLLLACAPVANVGDVAQAILNGPARLIDAHASRPEPTMIGLWRCEDRRAALATLCRDLGRRKLRVTIVAHEPAANMWLGRVAEETGATIGIPPRMAGIALVSGVPRTPAERAALTASGYRLILMLAADAPHEHYFAARPEQLLADLPWMQPGTRNPYVDAFHLQAAASERPLTMEEVEGWQMLDLASRLSVRSRLRPVASAFHSGDAAPASLPHLWAATSVNPPVAVRDPRGNVVAQLLPHVADWRGLPGTTWSDGLIVANRTDEPPAIDLAVVDEARRAQAGLSLELAVRETIDRRQWSSGARTLEITRAKLQVRQRVAALVAFEPWQPPQVVELLQPRESSWNASGVSLALPIPVQQPETAGWAVLQALPHVLVTRVEDVVISYDRDAQRLWVVETEPGGTGRADSIFQHFESIIEVARQIARAARQSSLYGSLAHAELAWLDALWEEESREAVLSPTIATPHQAVPCTKAVTSSEDVPATRRPRVYSRPTVPAPGEPDAAMPAQPSLVVFESEPELHAPEERGGEARRVARRYAVPDAEHAAGAHTQQIREAYLPLEDAAYEPVTPPAFEPAWGAPEPTDALEDNVETAAETDVAEEWKESPGIGEPADEDGVLSPGARPPEWAAEQETASIEGARVLPSEDPVPDVSWQVDLEARDEELQDIAWETGSNQELIEALLAEAGLDQADLEDITWEAGRPSAEQAGTPTEQPSPIPPLGREARVPLNAPRRSSRNAAPRAARREETADADRTSWVREQAGVPYPRHPSSDNAPATQGQHKEFSEPSAPVPAGTSSDRQSGGPNPASNRPVDVGAMIARMRRLREEREGGQGPTNGRDAAPAQEVVMPSERFHPGQRVTCVPYGEGVVRDARIVRGREQLTIEFPDEGELTVDPAVNAVRVVEAHEEESEEDSWSD